MGELPQLMHFGVWVRSVRGSGISHRCVIKVLAVDDVEAASAARDRLKITFPSYPPNSWIVYKVTSDER